MAYQFHHDHAYYLRFLSDNARESILPFIAAHHPRPVSSWEVLELGCGEGGNLLPFAEAGAHCTGIDLNAAKIEEGKVLMAAQIQAGHMQLQADDIFNPAIAEAYRGRFDVILLKDVIEHIPNKEKALRQMHSFLKPDGLLFIGWPPWRMPFGGHQQIADSKIIRVFPWLHLLPKAVYVAILRLVGEGKAAIDELAEIHDYKVSIRQMDRLYRASGFGMQANIHYLINPIYAYKFGLKARKQFGWLKSIPWLRDFFTTSCYYLLAKRA